MPSSQSKLNPSSLTNQHSVIVSSMLLILLCYFSHKQAFSHARAQFVTPRQWLCNEASQVAGLALEVLQFHYADRLFLMYNE